MSCADLSTLINRNHGLERFIDYDFDSLTATCLPLGYCMKSMKVSSLEFVNREGVCDTILTNSTCRTWHDELLLLTFEMNTTFQDCATKIQSRQNENCIKNILWNESIQIIFEKFATNSYAVDFMEIAWLLPPKYEYVYFWSYEENPLTFTTQVAQ